MEETPSTSKGHIKVTLVSEIMLQLSIWTIRAMIFAKSSIYNWNKNNKNGKVINIDVQDNSGKIRIVAYNEYAEKIDSIFNVGDIIQLSKGLLIPTNKKWCKIDHPVTINISKYSIFEKCPKSFLDAEIKIGI